MIRTLALLLAFAPLPALAQQAAPPAPFKGALLAPALHVSDMDRALRFYTEGLGMEVAVKLDRGTAQEVILSFDKASRVPALILLHDSAPGKSPPLVLGNGLAHVVLRMPDLAGLASRLKAAGYDVGDVSTSSVGPRTLMVKDPDGYEYEIVEAPAPRG